MKAKELVALALYAIGIRPKVSTGICGRLTYGYGALDDHGYWQFMLRVERVDDE